MSSGSSNSIDCFVNAEQTAPLFLMAKMQARGRLPGLPLMAAVPLGAGRDSQHAQRMGTGRSTSR
jgi:hypothetical protein